VGTSLLTTASHHIAQWLVEDFPRQVSIDWDEMPESDLLAAILMPLIPGLAEEALVDANVDLKTWMGTNANLKFLLQADETLFDALAAPIRWKFANGPASRTRMRRPARPFYQSGPMLARRDISLERELSGPRLKVRTLTRREGEKALDMARAALVMRGREVYVFNYGDASTIVSADCGRGVEILLFGIVPERRLPLRAGFAPLIFRNGVPIGYADAYGICDRMEVSFNIFYAFRDAEAAFIFARMLKLYRQLFGSASFSLDPYQIGLGNDEAIDAGAYWFYRKLGFHSTDPAIERLAQREEARIAADPEHRSSRATLRRVAKSPMIYDVVRKGEWDRFSVRRLAQSGIELPRAIARAKRGKSEREYLRLTARDAAFRRMVLELASGRPSPGLRPPSPR
jgi:hypothetical protein